ncbi:MAG TPA: NAD(P)-dependent alcohol dehydrogenase [Anaerolineales bacterium]|nr:NAD(P)-dependent alcohol dehydrogenase [Anaerolineales bacterium]
MKAIVWTKYGPPDVLRFQEVEKPTPRDDEVLIKIHATTVTAGDCELRNLKLPILFRLAIRAYVGLRKPTRITILGQELAGEIDAVGKDVKRLKPGDQVFGTTGLRFGAYAEYICLPEQGALVLKPSNMTYEEAAAVPTGGLEALHFIRKADLQHAQKVLINGSGGSIGTFALQLAKYFGTHVTAVDSTEKVDTLRLIGADRVIDYTREDFTKSRETYDVIFDVVGKSSFSRSIESLKQNGRYLLGNSNPLQRIRGQWTSMSSSRKVLFGTSSQRAEDLLFLKELIEARKLKAVVDRCYPLAQIAEAHRYVETGHKKGNVVITVDPR